MKTMKPVFRLTLVLYLCLFLTGAPFVLSATAKITPKKVDADTSFYEVRKGDTLWDLAKKYRGNGYLWKEFEKYNSFISRKNTSIEEILRFAVYFHNEFQHIHPFEDGNSRTTRLITFHFLQSFDIPIFDIPFGLLDEYLRYTKGSRSREDKNLYNALQKIILFNLKKINEKLSQ